MTYAVPVCLPGYVGAALLALACSRRVPALRPVVAAFAAWSLLDAVTGPLWLRAGVCVAWPGVAVVAAVWGLRSGVVNRKLTTAIAAVYILAGCVAALSYRAHAPAFYHLALPLSRLSTLPFAAHALLSRPWSRPWATRAAVTPLLGLACGVVLGVWTLLPAGLESVREQWARLAGAETWATMAGVAVCCVGAWWEATTSGSR